MAEEYEEQGAAEDDAPYYLASAPRELVREVRLGRLLCSILRFRAKTMGLPMNAEGFVPLEYLVRHPVMDGYALEEILKLVRTDNKKRYKIVQDSESKLHIRAQNGHSSMLPVDIKHPEVPTKELPERVAHLTKQMRVMVPSLSIIQR